MLPYYYKASMVACLTVSLIIIISLHCPEIALKPIVYLPDLSDYTWVLPHVCRLMSC